MIRIVAAALVAVALGVIGVLYVHSRDAVVQELIADSQRADVQAFDARVDWETLRANLKKSIAEQKTAMGANGVSMGPALADIGKVVDYYVQPGNIDIAYYIHKEMFPMVKEQDFIYSTGYAFPFGFQITLGYPKSIPANDIPQLLKDRMKVRLVFGLDGLTWKLRNMQVPLFMTPSQVYPTPALKMFGRPGK